MTTPSSETAEVLEAARRPMWSRLLRVARDFVLGGTVIAAIPLAFIVVSEHRRDGKMNYPQYQLLEIERFRTLGAPVEPSITPEAAGAAMRRLLPTGAALHTSSSGMSPWNPVLPPGFFRGYVDTAVWNGPMPDGFIKAAAQGIWTYEQLGISPSSGLQFSLSDGFGMSRAEQDWLKALAESPAWKDLDLVAGAARLDLAEVGQRTQPSFNEQIARSRRLAFAGVARAAYYVSIGDHARAEAALRSLVSFGFALLDNSVLNTERLIGRQIVQAGCVGLRQLYVLERRSHLEAMTDLSPFYPERSGSQSPSERSAAVVRDEALRYVLDVSLPRSFRFEQLNLVARSTCSDVRSLLLGPSGDVQRAFDVARRTLAETDNERQYIDVLERNATARSVRAGPPSFVLQVVHGAAVVTSTVTGNSRITGCMGAVIGDMTLTSS